MNQKDIIPIIKGCRANNRNAQKELYQLFYNYGMTVCYRYARDEDEAKEMLNDAFMKVFTKIDRYTGELPFKAWFNRILVNTAIDYFRKSQQLPKTVDINNAQHFVHTGGDVVDELSVAEVFELVQKLPPAYRIVFNLYVVEGLKHHEIAEQLNISEGASKSNLAKARAKLKTMILDNEKLQRYAG